MSSPDPDVLKVRFDTDSEGEDISSLYKDSYKRYIDGYNIHNDKVRYYCNKTLSMRQPLNEIVDDLITLQYNVMSYLPQEPNIQDHYALSMVFTLISKTAAIIEWETLNHDCFWKDFCREIRVLRLLASQAQVATFECMHTVVDKANRAMEVLRGVVPMGNKVTDLRLRETLVQLPGEPTSLGIKVVWTEVRDNITIQWRDPAESAVHSLKLHETCESFKLRFLRCLIFHARKSLEQITLSMLRIDFILRREFSIPKLAKCNGLSDSQLMVHERAALEKSKRIFDGTWDDILTTISRFKLQLGQLGKQKDGFKKQIRNFKSTIALSSPVNKISVIIEDPFLFKIVSMSISEPYDFTMYPDRTEDFWTMIQDFWKLNKSNYKQIDLLLSLVYSSVSQIHDVIEKADRTLLRNKMFDIMHQRDKVQRYMKKALGVFKHRAFKEMDILNKLQNRSSTGTSRPDTSPRSCGEDDFETNTEFSSEVADNNNNLPQLWVQLAGGFEVSVGESKAFLVKDRYKGIKQFQNLNEREKIALTFKMVTALAKLLYTERCQAKIMKGRTYETKSLMKRLKSNDRMVGSLAFSVGNGVTYIKQMLELMQTIDCFSQLIWKLIW